MQRVLITAFLIGVALLGARIWLFATGNVIVLDRHGLVDAAELEGSMEHRRLSRIGWVYFGLPSFDASVRIRCKSGKVREFGYVTTGVETWVKVSRPCSLSQW